LQLTVYCPYLTEDNTGLQLAYHAATKVGVSAPSTGMLKLEATPDGLRDCCLFNPVWDFDVITVFAVLEKVHWMCMPFRIGTIASVGIIKLYKNLNLQTQPIEVSLSYEWLNKENLCQVYTFKSLLTLKNQTATPVFFSSCHDHQSSVALTVNPGEDIAVNVPLPETLLWKLRISQTGKRRVRCRRMSNHPLTLSTPSPFSFRLFSLSVFLCHVQTGLRSFLLTFILELHDRHTF